MLTAHKLLERELAVVRRKGDPADDNGAPVRPRPRVERRLEVDLLEGRPLPGDHRELMRSEEVSHQGDDLVDVRLVAVAVHPVEEAAERGGELARLVRVRVGHAFEYACASNRSEPVVVARPGDQVVEDPRSRFGGLGRGVRAAVEQQRPFVVGSPSACTRPTTIQWSPPSKTLSTVQSIQVRTSVEHRRTGRRRRPPHAANLSAPARPKTALTSRWWWASTLTQNCRRVDHGPGSRRLARAEQHEWRFERQRGERLAGEADRLAAVEGSDDGDAGAEVTERATEAPGVDASSRRTARPG